MSNANVVLEQDSAERDCLIVIYGFGGAAAFGGIVEGGVGRTAVE